MQYRIPIKDQLNAVNLLLAEPFCSSKEHAEQLLAKMVVRRQHLVLEMDPITLKPISGLIHEAKTLPSVITAVGKSVQAAVSITKTTVGIDCLSYQQVQERLSVCSSCPGGHATFRRGRVHSCGPLLKSLGNRGRKPCGCILKAKARDRKQQCPFGYWPTIEDNPKEDAIGQDQTPLKQNQEIKGSTTSLGAQALAPLPNALLSMDLGDRRRVMSRSERRGLIKQMHGGITTRNGSLARPDTVPRPRNSLYDWFDRVVVINLDRRPERWERLQRHLAEIGWPFRYPQRFSAIDGKQNPPPEWWRAGRPAWGCYQSHLQAIESALSDGVQSLLVLEDDVLFKETFREETRRFLEQVPSDWHSLYLGGQHIRAGKHPPTRVVSGVLRAHNINRMHAYAMKGPYLQAVADHLQDLDAHAQQHAHSGPQGSEKAHHVDHRMGVLHETKRWNIYCPERWLAGQSAGKSDISAKLLPDRYWQNRRVKAAGPAKKKLLITAHPRSGTKYIAKLCQAFGLNVGHERMGRDGISSWMMAVDSDYVPYGDGTVYKDGVFEQVIRLVRHPLDVLASSIYTENIENTSKPEVGDRQTIEYVKHCSFKARSWAFRRVFVQPEGNLYEQAVQTLLAWDTFIEKREPAVTIRVESAVKDLSAHLNLEIQPTKQLPGDRVHARNHPMLNWNDLQKNLRPSLVNALKSYADQYGYTLGRTSRAKQADYSLGIKCQSVSNPAKDHSCLPLPKEEVAI